MKTIILLLCLSIACVAQTTNVTIAINTNDLRFLPANYTNSISNQIAASVAAKREAKIIAKVKTLTPAQQRTLATQLGIE